MPKLGKQTWSFTSHTPYVQARATVAGQLECNGPLGSYFDIHHDNDRVDGDTWEHSEQRMFEEAVENTLRKAAVAPNDVDLLIGGDLNAQLTSFYHGLRAFPIPALGVYSACASICESLALASVLIDTGYANLALVGTSSHTSTAERQFRYPTEYGAQKPPTAQRTVTGSGSALLGTMTTNIAITHATIGVVNDFGIQSPWEMGAAMAPAAAATISTHLKDTSRQISDYDLIVTGDLGHIGHRILIDLLANEGIDVGCKLTDGGMLIYGRQQPDVFSGGSGGACCSLVTFGYLLHELQVGHYHRILVSATGALLSAISAQQSDSIPGISHAVVFERRGE